MAACAKIFKRENTGKPEDSKKVLHRQMIMDVGEGKNLKNCCVVENIEPQKKLRECDEIKDNGKSAHLCISLDRSKAVRNGGITLMCLRPL